MSDNVVHKKHIIQYLNKSYMCCVHVLTRVHTGRSLLCEDIYDGLCSMPFYVQSSASGGSTNDVTMTEMYKVADFMFDFGTFIDFKNLLLSLVFVTARRQLN